MTNGEFLNWIKDTNPTFLEFMQKFKDDELNTHQEIVISSYGVQLKESCVGIPCNFFEGK